MGFKKWNVYVCAFVCFYRIENWSTRLAQAAASLIFSSLSCIFSSPLPQALVSPPTCKWVQISPHLSFALVLLVNPWSTLVSFSVKIFETRVNTWGWQGCPCYLPHNHPWIPELPLPPTPTLLKLLLLRHPSPIPRQHCSHHDIWPP